MATSHARSSPPTLLRRIGVALGAMALLYLALGFLRSLHLVTVENQIGHDVRDVLLVLDGKKGSSGPITAGESAWIGIVHRPENDATFEVFIHEHDAWRHAGRACYVARVWSWHRLEIKSQAVNDDGCRILY